MRRSILLGGIAIGSLLLFTTSALYVQGDKVENFKTKLADLTFCKTAFDIAQSRPHYLASQTTDPKQKQILIKLSDELFAKKAKIEKLLAAHMKKADKLPLDADDTMELVDSTVWQAELEAVQIAKAAEEPEDFLSHLSERCDPYVN
jgi:hypothetical protein